VALDFTLKKANALQQLVAFSGKGLTMAEAVQEFVAQLTDGGFLTGGANPITDADCLLSPTTSHLTAALVNSLVTAINNLSLTAAQKTTVRQGIGGFITPPT